MIFAFRLDEILVGSRLDDFTIHDDNDVVCLHDGREAMSNEVLASCESVEVSSELTLR